MLDILKYPDPKLQQLSAPITEFSKDLHELLDQMAKTMYTAGGVGLAAPQVGKFICAFIVDIRPLEEERQLFEFLNPSLSEGQGKISFEEGCLSLPGITAEIRRKEKITIHYQDRYGEKKSMNVEGLLAAAVQHENDHLDGVLFIDRLSPLKRRFMKRKLAKSITL